MADSVYVDFSGVYRALDTVNSNIGVVENNMRVRFGEVDEELALVKKGLFKMYQEQVQSAALQRAITEIIRVRQELNDKFGNHKVVRSTMLGILQANDLQLVRQNTISNISEELMIKTPDYWLAPVLIALSAWISDNPDLANRAVKEALRRDREKTCLTFALVCRRNGRTDACFQWLARYFDMQDAHRMKESIIAYLDAYTNGVFGEDRDNLCDEYIEKWMSELRSPEFDRQQIDYWKKQYAAFTEDLRPKCPELAECAPEDFDKMNTHVQRLRAMPSVMRFFSSILNAEVDKYQLTEAIDRELKKLVENYETDEAELREEEERFTLIKKFNGNEKLADTFISLRNMRRMDKDVNLADRLTLVISSPSDQNVSAKKTAIRFLQDYIRTAVDEFVTEKAAEYPKTVTLTLNGWKGVTEGGKNKDELLKSYKDQKESERAGELSKVKDSWKGMLAGMAIFLLVFALGIVLAIVGGKRDPQELLNRTLKIVGIVMIVIGLLLGIVLGAAGGAGKQKATKTRANINANYDEQIKSGSETIAKCVQQIVAMDKVVANFRIDEVQAKLLLGEGK